MGYCVNSNNTPNCIFKRIADHVSFGKVLIVFCNHFMFIFLAFSRLRIFTYHVPLGTIYLTILKHSIFLFFIIVFTFKFWDGYNAEANNGSD